MTDPQRKMPSLLEEIRRFDPTKKTLSLLEEFQAFALKGNVIDLALAVVIGTAFGKIVDSLVRNLLMPLISLLLPGQDGYQAWKVTVGGTVIPYGLFLADVVNFLIIAAALFVFVVKLLGWLVRSRPQEAPPPTEQQLLTEIRDLLRQGVLASRTGSPPEPGGGGRS